MPATISDLLALRGFKEAAFARSIGIPASTLYSITRGKTRVSNIGVGTFVKIAHGLGMSAEELYERLTSDDVAGQDEGSTLRETLYADPRQRQLNRAYEQLDEQSKAEVAGMVASIAKDPDRQHASR